VLGTCQSPNFVGSEPELLGPSHSGGPLSLSAGDRQLLVAGERLPPNGNALVCKLDVLNQLLIHERARDASILRYGVKPIFRCPLHDVTDRDRVNE
jgi:hypothetical protein